MRTRSVLAGMAVASALAGSAALTSIVAAGADTTPTFSPAARVDSYGGGTEPRVTVAPNGKRYIASNQPDGTAEVYQSTDGISWHKTAGTLPGQKAATIDVDIVAMHTGRLLATELDTDGLNFVVGYSDDEGKTWTQSTGPGAVAPTAADQDRQWFAVGPDDATTHKPRVYLLFHNLGSGQANHNMFVATSTDGGASFGPPIPTTLPGSQAYLDLQCADSGGPSNIMVNQKTGQVYAVFGTRSSPLPGGVVNAGGCGASITGSFQFNIVAATKIWIVTSNDGITWTQHVAVDDSGTQNIVGMQLDVATMDSAGNIYAVYPESPHPFPNYSQAPVKMRWAPGDLSHWSAPVTVNPGGSVGNMLVHAVAGDPGKVDIAYFNGVARAGKGPLWYATASQTLNAMSTSPTFTQTRLSDIPTYTLTPAQMMGACTPSGIVNGLACNRSTDVWGVALDNSCNLVVTWPVTGDASQNDVSSKLGGTYATSQVGGSRVCGQSAAFTFAPTPAPPTPKVVSGGSGGPNTAASMPLAGLGLVGLLLLLAAGTAGAVARLSSRRR